MGDPDRTPHIRDIMQTPRDMKEIAPVAMCGYTGSANRGIWAYYREAEKGNIRGCCEQCLRAWNMEKNSSKLSERTRHKLRIRMMNVVNMNMKKATYR